VEILELLAAVAFLASAIWSAVLRSWSAMLLAVGLLLWLISTAHIELG
jgi:hypothetical protein